MESAKDAFCDEHMDATRRPLGKPSQSGMRRILLLLEEMLLLLWIEQEDEIAPGAEKKKSSSVCFAVVVTGCGGNFCLLCTPMSNNKLLPPLTSDLQTYVWSTKARSP